MDCANYIKIGSTLTIDITRVNGDDPVPLTNVEIESYIKHNKYGSYEMEVEVIDELEGQIKLTLDADTTVNMPSGDYEWDIKFTDPDGKVEKFPKNNNVILTFTKGPTP